MGDPASVRIDSNRRTSRVAALGLIVLASACSSEPLTGQGHAGSGGSTGGSTGQGNAGEDGAGGQGGDVPLGFGGDYGGGVGGSAGSVGGGAGALGGSAGALGSIGSLCTLSSDCLSGLYCYLDSCNSSNGSCRALGTNATNTCDPLSGPVCGCDGKQYASDCDAYDRGISALNGSCPSPVGTPCAAGSLTVCGLGEYCQVMVCGDPMGVCQTMPDVATCTGATATVCGCDDRLYDLPCAAAANGTSIRNVGPCPPLPSGPCSSQADCGGAAYANLVSCVSTSCSGPAGTCTPLGAGCDIDLVATDQYEVCGCDGQTYNDPCAARAAGVKVASQGPCTDAGASP